MRRRTEKRIRKKKLRWSHEEGAKKKEEGGRSHAVINFQVIKLKQTKKDTHLITMELRHQAKFTHLQLTPLYCSFPLNQVFSNTQ